MSHINTMVAVGQIVKRVAFNQKTIVKVRMQRMSFDKHLLMYFPRKVDRWSLDDKDETKVGDVVVIRNLNEKFGKNIVSKVDSILYETGAVRDPITGRLCRGTEFIDEEERTIEQSKRTVEILQKRSIVEVDTKN